jgi:hypothetical protein
MKAHAFGSLPPVSTITLGGGGLGMLWGVLCNIPLDLPVDELVTWRELAGDSRLANALAACEESGWDALPLGPNPLSPYVSITL